MFLDGKMKAAFVMTMTPFHGAHSKNSQRFQSSHESRLRDYNSDDIKH